MREQNQPLKQAMEKISAQQPPRPPAQPVKPMEWKAPEYEYREKTPDWFWILGIITLALAFAAVMLDNAPLGILIGLAGFSLALYGAKRPEIVTFRIGPKGVKVKDKIYEYENLESFWINYDPPRKKQLIIRSKKTFMPHIKIMLGEEDPEKIREYLLQFIKEEKIEESFTEIISEILKF